MEQRLFKGLIDINKEYVTAEVVIIQNSNGNLHYVTMINNDLKRFVEVSINDCGTWYDIKKGVTNLSVAIGNLIESKTF